MTRFCKTVRDYHGNIYMLNISDYVRLKRARKRVLKAANGYGRVWTQGQTELLHRWVMSAKRGHYIDHKNGDVKNCCRWNLRKCTNQQNCSNSRKPKNNTSGYKGVTRCGMKWQVRVKVKYKTHSFGRYFSKEVAARIYDREAVRLFGEFANLNFPEDRKTAPNFVAPKNILYSGNTTGYRGVCPARHKFIASIRVQGKLIHLGTFERAKEAAMAYDAKAKEVLGENAKLNFANRKLRVKP